MSYGTIILADHPRRKKAARNKTPVKALNHSKPCSRNSQTNTNLMIEIQISVLDVAIPYIHKDLTAWLRSTNANIAQKSDTSQRCALPKMHTCRHSNIVNVSQNRHIRLLYLNILLSSTKIHAAVIMMMIYDSIPIMCSATEKCTQPTDNHRLHTETSVCQYSILTSTLS